jgi:2'-5' RNA ligase
MSAAPAETAQYAVVSYIAGLLADFAGQLRQQLAPEQSHLRAHVTLLPPRSLAVGETVAAEAVRALCRRWAPLRISVDRVETFLPLHPTVYLRVDHGARHLRSIYESLNAGVLTAADPWPYVPHLTLATLPDAARTEAAFLRAAEQWRQYSGEREFMLQEAVLVREESRDRWLDIEVFTFGG